MTAAGDFSFTVRVTDSSPTPKTVDKAFDMSVDVPSNPSLAVFFDGSATVCTSTTLSWTPVNCYVFIMLDEEDMNCAQACEFKLRITDADNADLDAGAQYYDREHGGLPRVCRRHARRSLQRHGDQLQQADVRPEPVLVASFDLMLMEDLQNLSFKFDAQPGRLARHRHRARPDIPIVNATGREAGINY